MTKEITQDLKSPVAGEWLVIGWFTADYRPLAETFAANLQEHNIPHHLFFRFKKSTEWNTQQKPLVVLEAMATHPGKTLILMDVDCVVNGDISALAKADGDVGITVTATNA